MKLIARNIRCDTQVCYSLSIKQRSCNYLKFINHTYLNSYHACFFLQKNSITYLTSELKKQDMHCFMTSTPHF